MVSRALGRNGSSRVHKASARHAWGMRQVCTRPTIDPKSKDPPPGCAPTRNLRADGRASTDASVVREPKPR